jgi:hypothetical protein
VELREVIRRLKLGQRIRRIQERTGILRTIIRSLRDGSELRRNCPRKCRSRRPDAGKHEHRAGKTGLPPFLPSFEC